MSEKIGLTAHFPSDRGYLPGDLSRRAPSMKLALNNDDYTSGSTVEPVRSDTERLADYLQTRGLEVDFRINPEGGLPQLVIWDPVSGRTVVEVPRGSSLERSLGEMFQRTR